MSVAAKQNRSGESVTLSRGGKEVVLFKSPNLIAVRLRDGAIPENLLGRVTRGLALPPTVRFVKRYPSQRVGIFYSAAGDRDAVMDRLRSQSDMVQYCSHVLQRRPEDELPGGEIGLDNKLFVEFEKGPTKAEIWDMEQAHGLRAIWRFPEEEQGIVFELTEAATENPIKITRKLVDTRKVRVAEPCLIEAKVGKAIPYDVGFRRQWHLLNTGQGEGKPRADCNAIEAWDYTWGDPRVTIALIDDGFDLEHADFQGRGKVRFPYDATQHDTNPSPSDFRENHGTACAGVAISARGKGIAVGVAPDCSFMPIRHAGRLGDYDEALAFYHIFQHKADVISCSWGPPDAYQDEFWPMPRITQFVINICVKHGRRHKGIPIFFAAGNGNEPLALDGYANYKNVIAVAACTNQDQKAWYSDYGENVWVTAPSSGGTLGIFTTDRTGPDGYSWDSDYTVDFGGTSAAAPLVAGIAALMLSVNPDLTVAQIKEILKETAVKINQAEPKTYQDYWGNDYSDEYEQSGHSLVYGWGRVDAGAAVAEAQRLRGAR
jgi:subtilisin family serine protease